MDQELIELNIGIDDVDSPQGGCTTHLATIMSWKLLQRGIEFLDYPNLIRLNPAIPWKTRGNGAVALRVLARSEDEVEKIAGILVAEIDQYCEEYRNPKHQPALVIHQGGVTDALKKLAGKALYDIVTLDLAMRVLEKTPSIRAHFISGKRGLIGALAAIGYTMRNTDHTYELLAYRTREYLGKPRAVDEKSIIEVDKIFGHLMILNYDYTVRRPLITPKGPDPVLFGLRGEDPLVLINALKLLRIYEPMEYIAIFRTNQHTDSHIHRVDSICDVRPYMCVSVKGFVKTKPSRKIGGHVFFDLCDMDCCITVAVYEPTKEFRDIAEKLEPGDEVEAYGCIRPPGLQHGMTLNLEKLHVIRVTPLVVYENPVCPRCGKRMESAGRGKGYKCRRCGFRDNSLTKTITFKQRDISPGWYQPPHHAFKHLMKPIERFGKEKSSFNEKPVQGFIKKIS
ncbi:MAG: tRNA(Ile)(2)-agmatinylcytidine synthase [Desulfurococcaceae archaeon]